MTSVSILPLLPILHDHYFKFKLRGVARHARRRRASMPVPGQQGQCKGKPGPRALDSVGGIT